jgi:hypothetical protein
VTLCAILSPLIPEMIRRYQERRTPLIVPHGPFLYAEGEEPLK